MLSVADPLSRAPEGQHRQPRRCSPAHASEEGKLATGGITEFGGHSSQQFSFSVEDRREEQEGSRDGTWCEGVTDMEEQRRAGVAEWHGQ